MFNPNDHENYLRWNHVILDLLNTYKPWGWANWAIPSEWQRVDWGLSVGKIGHNKPQGVEPVSDDGRRRWRSMPRCQNMVYCSNNIILNTLRYINPLPNRYCLKYHDFYRRLNYFYTDDMRSGIYSEEVLKCLWQIPAQDAPKMTMKTTYGEITSYLTF